MPKIDVSDLADDAAALARLVAPMLLPGATQYIALGERVARLVGLIRDRATKPETKMMLDQSLEGIRDVVRMHESETFANLQKIIDAGSKRRK